MTEEMTTAKINVVVVNNPLNTSDRTLAELEHLPDRPLSAYGRHLGHVEKGLTDFDDLGKSRGNGAVRQAIEAAVARTMQPERSIA